MVQKRLSVPEAELSVLQALWEAPGLTIRELTDRLYPGGDVAHYSTVQKLLERLEGRGLANRDRTAARHRFYAAVAKDQLVLRELETVAESFGSSSLVQLVCQLFGSQKLSAADRAALRKLVERDAKPHE